MGFSFFNPLFCSFLQSCYHFLLHYSAIPAVMSFGPSLLEFFGPAACSSLNDLAWSLGFIFVTLLAGSCVPFISSWASLAHLLSLGFLRLFPNSTLPWSFTNSFRPLLSLFALLRVCCGLFSLFYITYYPWVCYFSLFKLLLGPFASSRPIYLFHKLMIH